MLSMKHFPTNYNTQLKPPTLFNMYLKHYIVCMNNCQLSTGETYD